MPVVRQTPCKIHRQTENVISSYQKKIVPIGEPRPWCHYFFNNWALTETDYDYDYDYDYDDDGREPIVGMAKKFLKIEQGHQIVEGWSKGIPHWISTNPCWKIVEFCL